MNPLPQTAPYTLLQARGVGARAGEALNVGVVLHLPESDLVAFTGDARRMSALHPDYAATPMADRAAQLSDTLAEQGRELTPEQRRLLLRLLALPFQPADHTGVATLHESGPQQTLRELMAALVDAPKRRLKLTRTPRVRTSKLASEIKDWLRAAKAFSPRVEDLRRNKVVANYPIAPAAQLYADFAVLNGKLNALEILDLRGLEKLTPGVRGDAALKGITLDEAREHIDGKRLLVLKATNYAVARPAIHLAERYADDVFDLTLQTDQHRLAQFFANALHREELPGLAVGD